MQRVTDHIRQHLYNTFIPPIAPSLEHLRKTQWCDEYEYYRRNRMVQGFFRYGDINRQELSDYDLPRECIKRVCKYEQDHNLEHLVDAGNLAMLAYMQGKKSGHLFNSIDDGEHAKKGTRYESYLARFRNNRA